MIRKIRDDVTVPQGLHAALEWRNLHKTGAGGATALACHGDNIATGGQDGKINILVRDSKSPLKVNTSPLIPRLLLIGRSNGILCSD